MKVCKDCGLKEPLVKFNKGRNACVACTKIRYCTFKAVLAQTYSTQKTRSKQRGHQPPNYTKEELRRFILSYPGFRKLWRDWLKSSFNKMLRPSCDRINDDLGYTFSNLRVVTWEENLKSKKTKSVRTYTHPDKKYRRPTRGILQYTLDGKFIAEHYSAQEAILSVGLKRKKDITDCCNGKRITAGGFVWKYKS